MQSYVCIVSPSSKKFIFSKTGRPVLAVQKTCNSCGHTGVVTDVVREEGECEDLRQ